MPDEIRGFEGTSPQPGEIGRDDDGHRIARGGSAWKRSLPPVKAPCINGGQFHSAPVVHWPVEKQSRSSQSRMKGDDGTAARRCGR